MKFVKVFKKWIFFFLLKVFTFIFERKEKTIKTLNEDEYYQKMLKKLVTENKDTQIGNTYKFNNIRTMEDYVKQVPVHRWKDLKPYVERMMKGETNITFVGEISHFARTSSTTASVPKIIATPKKFSPFNLTFPFHTFESTESKESMFIANGVIFLKYEIPISFNKNKSGVEIGTATGNTRNLKVFKKLSDFYYAHPFQVLHQRFRIGNFWFAYFALRNPKIYQIVGLFAPTVVAFFRTLENQFFPILEMIESGKIPKDIAKETVKFEELKEIVEKNKDPNRSTQLKQFFESNNKKFDENFYSKVWPKLKIIQTAVSGQFAFYISTIKQRCPNVVLGNTIYAASEGFLGKSYPRYNKPVQFELSTHTTIFEFMEIEGN